MRSGWDNVTVTHGGDEVWVVDIMVDPWVHCGSGEVWVDVITVGQWMLWGTDGVWVDVVLVLDALGNG